MFANSFAPSQREFIIAYFVAFIICTSYQANAILISDALNGFCIRNIINEFTDCRAISSLCVVVVVYIVGSKCKAELCSVIQPSCAAFASQIGIVVSVLGQTNISACCQESLCSIAFQTDVCGVDTRVTINLRSNSRSGLLTSLYKGSRFVRTICLILTKYPFEGATIVRNRSSGCGYSRRSSSRCSRSGCNSFCCGCFFTRCGCSSSCSFASVRNLNNQVAVYISCINLGVVYASPVKQLTALIVQLVFFENKWEFIISTIFIIVLQFQTVCFCNTLNSIFIRNVVEQGEERIAIYQVAASNLLCTGGRNAPAQTLRVFFPATEVQEFVYCIVGLISIACCIQQSLCRCTFVIGLKCNSNTFGIRCIVQVQRNLCILLFRCYNDVFALVDCHGRAINNEVCLGCSSSCSFCSSSCNCSCGGRFNACYRNADAAIYISCINLGVVYASPVKQLTALVVQLFFFENKREFVISTVFSILLQFQTICCCNALNSCFIRNVVEQGKERIAIYQVAASNLLCTGGRNAPAQTLRVFFPATEVQEFVYCIVRLVSIAACIQQSLCCCTFVIGLKCNGDTFGIRCIVQVQRNLCVLLFRCYENLFAVVDCHGRFVANNQSTIACSGSLCFAGSCRSRCSSFSSCRSSFSSSCYRYSGFRNGCSSFCCSGCGSSCCCSRSFCIADLNNQEV